MSKRIPRCGLFNAGMWSKPFSEPPPKSKPPDVPTLSSVRCSIPSAVARFIRNGCFILTGLIWAVVAQADITISPSSLSDGTTGTAYSLTFTADGGSGTYVWSCSGNWVDGLSWDANSATISGTPTTPGTCYLTVSASDDGGNTWTYNTCTLTVNDPPPVQITTGSPLPDGLLGVYYAGTLNAIGGTGSYTWSVTSGSLPSGLNLDANGTISGTPTMLETVYFTVCATDSNGATGTKDVSMTISLAPVQLGTGGLPAGMVGNPYSQALSVTGGSGSYTWSLTGGGSLPPSLTLNTDGTITGTPWYSGTFNFTVTVSDTMGGSGQADYQLVINDIPPPPPLGITTTSLPDATVGGSYSVTLGASGGSGSYTWSVSGSSLPAGLSLDSNGTISGTPTTPGGCNFTINVADQSGGSAQAWFQITINTPPNPPDPPPQDPPPDPPSLAISTSSPLPNGTVGSSYQQSLNASNGSGSYSWSIVDGSLPTGLSLDSNGTISGTPTGTGNSSFQVSVSDGSGNSAQSWFAMAIDDAPQLQIITGSPLPSGQPGSYYSGTLAADGGAGDRTWSVTGGSLPNGLTLDSVGNLCGTPIAAGSYNFTAQATDGYGHSTSKSFDISITTPGNNETVTANPAGYLSFNGFNYAAAANNEAFTSATGTFELLYRSTDTTDDRLFAGTYNVFGGYCFKVFNSGGSSLCRFIFTYSGGAPELEQTSSVNIRDGQWHHLAATWGDGTLTLWIDGVLENSTPISTPVAGGDMMFGTVPFWNGQVVAHAEVCDIRLARLSGSAKYTAAFSKPTTLSAGGDTIGFWAMTQADGSAAHDFSDHGFEATLVADSNGNNPVWGSMGGTGTVQITGPPSFSNVEGDSVQISWDVSNTTGMALHNVVHYSWSDGENSGSGEAVLDIDGSSGSVSVAVEGLVAGRTYSFWVESGTSNQSMVATRGNNDGNSYGFTTEAAPTIVLSGVSGPTITPYSNDPTQVDISWDVTPVNPANHQHQVTVLNTTITAVGVEDGNGHVTATLMGLSPGTEYHFAIQSSGWGQTVVQENGGSGYLLVTQSSPEDSLQFSAANYSISENGGPATITVTRTGGNGGTMTVNYGVSDNSAGGMLSFEPGEASKSFTVPVTPDNTYTGDRTLGLTLSDPQGGVLGSPSSATLTITDVDTPSTGGGGGGGGGTPPADPDPSISVSDVQTSSIDNSTETISWLASVSGVHNNYFWSDTSQQWVLMSSENWTAAPDNNTVICNGSSITANYDPNTGRASATLSNLTPGTPYTFMVQSTYGNVSASIPNQSFTTSGTPPPPPALDLRGFSASGVVGTYFSQPFTITSGTLVGSPSLTLTDGNLPEGLSLSGLALSGYPTTPGTYNFAVQVNDGYHTPGQASCQVAFYSSPSLAIDSQISYGYSTSSDYSYNTITVSWHVSHVPSDPAQFTHVVHVSELGDITGQEDASGNVTAQFVVPSGFVYHFWVESSGNGLDAQDNHSGNNYIVSGPALVGLGNWHLDSVAYSSATISWSVYGLDCNYSSFTYTDGVTTWSAPIITNGNHRTASLSGLTPGQTYNFTIRVDSGWDPTTYPLATSATQAGSFGTLPPMTISALITSATGFNTANISWMVDNIGGQAFTNTVFYWLDGTTGIGSPSTAMSVNDPDNSVVNVTLTGLQPDQVYDYYVRSGNSFSSATAPISYPSYNQFQTRPTYVSIVGRPTLGAVDPATGSASLNWTIQNSSGASVNNVVTYTWNGSTGRGSGQTSPVVTGPGQTHVSVNISDLIPGATYHFSASSSAVGYQGDALYSQTFNGAFTVGANGESTWFIRISGVAANWITDTSASIGWQVDKADPDDVAHHYVVATTNFPPFDLQQAVITEGTEATDQSGAVTALLTGLTPAANYYYYVQSAIHYDSGFFTNDMNGGNYYTFTTQSGNGSPRVNGNATPSVIILDSPVVDPVGQTNAVVAWDYFSLTNPVSHYVVFSTNAVPTPADAFIATARSAGTEEDFGTVIATLEGLPPGQTNYYFVQSVVDLGEGNNMVLPTDGYLYWFVTAKSDATANGGGPVADGSNTNSGTANCNGIPYDPGTQGCYHGIIFQLSEGVIRGGIIVPIGAGSGDGSGGGGGGAWPYQCGGYDYDPETEECCGGIPVPTGQCCTDSDGNGTWYDPDTQECCSGSPVPKGWCCQGNWYDRKRYCCADDGTILLWGQCSWPRCNGRPYDSTKYSCCHDMTIYNSSKEDCCNDGIIVPIGVSCPQDQCPGCDYSQNWCSGCGCIPINYDCCWDGTTAPSGMCPFPPPPPSPKCNGVEIPDGQECCYDHLVDIGACPIPTVSITSSCDSPCIVGTNQTIQLNASVSDFGSGNVTYRWQYPQHGWWHESEGDSLAFITDDTMLGQAIPIYVTASDNFGRGASTNYVVNVPQIVFTYAGVDENGNPTDSGVPIDYISIWTPFDGVDSGQPIEFSPEPVFQMSFVGTDMQVTLLGANHVLKKLKTNPLIYKENSSDMTVRLNQEPLNDPDVVGYLEATVTYSSAGIIGSLYACDETTAGSSVFVHNTSSLILDVGTLDDSKPNTIALEVNGNSGGGIFSMTETGVNTLIFTNTSVKAHLLNRSDSNSTLMVVLTATEFGLSSTALPLTPYGGSVYRNFAPPVPTSVAPDLAPLEASFFVEVQIIGADNDVSNKVANLIIPLTMETDSGDSQLCQVNLTSAWDGVWHSTTPTLVCRARADTAGIPGVESYQVAQAAPDAIPGGKATASVPASTGQPIKEGPVCAAGAIVVGYLPERDRLIAPAQDLKDAADWLTALGYKHTPPPELNAKVAKFADYIANKEVLVLDCHGVLGGRTSRYYPPYQGGFESYGMPEAKLKFSGFMLSDGQLGLATIQQAMANRKTPFRLVIANACASAQSSTYNQTTAIRVDPTLDVKKFAYAFVQSTFAHGGGTYVGWGWPVSIKSSSSMPKEFLSYCAAKNRTAETACALYLANHSGGACGEQTLKVCGYRKDVVVDLHPYTRYYDPKTQ